MMTNEQIGQNLRSKTDIIVTLKAILADLLTLEDEQSIQPTSRLREDLAIDSLALVDFIVALEDNFQIKMSSTFDASEIITVEDTADLILKLQAEQEQGNA